MSTRVQYSISYLPAIMLFIEYPHFGCVKLPLSKRPQIGFQEQLSLNAGQKYWYYGIRSVQ